ncbi:CBU_0592 family membrane protein [Cupriavidus oxalaticus]|uniref:CBU_0592 family membrane protein n=1 Tax=Cupriavidus oxalaticus TaxID=96344 RepID=UPI004034AAB9
MSADDVIGIIGVICYQIAYAGLQLGRLQRDGKLYFYLNLFGPCCLLYSLIFHFNLAAAISQLLWLMWSVVGMVITVRARRRPAIPKADGLAESDQLAH